METLRNGSVEPEVNIARTMKRLQDLLSGGERQLLEEMQMVAHDPEHQPPADIARRLRSMAMLPLGSTERNIIQSAVFGHGKGLHLVNPRANAKPE